MKLDPKIACPLSPALVRLLQSCLDCRSTHDKNLAEHLFLSPETMHTEFKLIAQCLDTHERFEAVMIALEKGWISLAFALPLPPPLKTSLQNINNRVYKNYPQTGYCAGLRLLLY